MRLDEISAALRALGEADLLRLPESESELAARRGWIDFASNDYLGLASRGLPAPDVSRETSTGSPHLADRDEALPTGAVSRATSSGVEAPGPQRAAGASSAGVAGTSPGPELTGATLLGAPAAPLAATLPSQGSGQFVPDVSRATPDGHTTAPTGLNVSRATSGGAPHGERLGTAPGVRGVGTADRLVEAGGRAGGSGASRLVFGTHPPHLAAEAALADWLDYEAALTFSSGYAANVGALGALLSVEDCVLSDELNHASLIDGIRLSRARATIVPHLDLAQLEAGLRAGQGARARWVVLESYSSMDGDGPDLRRVRELCDRYDAALYLDEAHGVGLFGPAGRGRAAEAGVRADVLMAGLGKAVGAQGGAILGSAELRTWLWNRARSFVFSTAPAPLTATMLVERIGRVRAADAERARLLALAAQTRERLLGLGFDLGSGSFGPILGLRLGEAERALRWAAALRSAGFLAQAIRPPTVPALGSRLRLTLRASHRDDDVERLIACLTDIRDRERTP